MIKDISKPNIMHKIQQEDIYDSNDQTDHQPTKNNINRLKIQYTDITPTTIQQFIELIRKTFTSIPPEAIVQATYKSLGLHQRHEEPLESILKQSTTRKSQAHSQSSYLNGKYPQSARFFEDQQDAPRKRGRPRKTQEQEKKPKSFKHPIVSQYQLQNRAVEQSRLEKERQFAQILVEEGYGIGIAKRRVLFQFDPPFYYNSMRNVMYRSFKKLEEKVQTQCKEQIIVDQEHKTMKFKTELCSFDRWLPADESQTFKQYIKSVYDLNPLAVSKGKTVRLYHNILRRWAKARTLDGRYREGNTKIQQSSQS